VTIRFSALFAAMILLATPALAVKVPTDGSLDKQVSRSTDCKAVRSVALAAEFCWLDLDSRSSLSNAERTQKRALANLYVHAADQHDVKLSCKPPLGGLGNGDRKPLPGETEPGPWHNPFE